MHTLTPKRTPTLPYRTQADHDSTLPQACTRSPTPVSPPAPSARHAPASLSLLAFAPIGSRNELPPPANHDLHVSRKSSRHLQTPCHVSCHVPPAHSTTYSSPLLHPHQNAHQLTSIVHKQTMTPPLGPLTLANARVASRTLRTTCPSQPPASRVRADWLSQRTFSTNKP
jgi:hypothetical protein